MCFERGQHTDIGGAYKSWWGTSETSYTSTGRSRQACAVTSSEPTAQREELLLPRSSRHAITRTSSRAPERALFLHYPTMLLSKQNVSGRLLYQQRLHPQRRCLSLAYSLHQPQDLAVDSDHVPIIMMHGLFGSKQNNRSISR